MDIQWSLILTQSYATATRGKTRDAFADPLEGPEWENLGWLVPLAARLIARSDRQIKKEQKIKQVERFTEAAPPKAVCVS